MIRRTALILTALILLLCGTASAGGGAYFHPGTGVTARDTGVYPVNFMMWTGPGFEYEPFDYEVCCDLNTATVTVYSQVWSGGQLWIQAEATHPELGKVRGYMVAYDSDGAQVYTYDGSSVPWEDTPGDFPSTWACDCYEVEALRYGPGERYAYMYNYFAPDDYGTVIMTDGDWALVEGPAHSEYEKQRGWLYFDELIY